MDEDQQQWHVWVQRLADGDEQAASEFWEQYGSRLQKLAEKQLATRIQRRIGPEDIAQSACRTFLRRAQQGEFQFDDSQSMWRLLCAITITKVRWHVRFHRRKKRNVDEEVHFDAQASQSDSPVRHLPVDEPTPEEAVEFADQFEQLLSGMDEKEQLVLQLKLEQRTNDEVAEQMSCSERTVRRILKQVKTRLRDMLDESVEQIT